MFEIKRMHTWYRPYAIGSYFVSEIHFYDKNGVIVSTSSGWLAKGNEDLEVLEVPTEPRKRMKVNFDRNEVFYISKGKDYSGELKCALYLPIDIFEWEVFGETGEHLSYNQTQIHKYKDYKAKNGVALRQYTETREHAENKRKRDDFIELVALFTGNGEDIREMYFHDNFDKILLKMNELVSKYPLPTIDGWTANYHLGCYYKIIDDELWYCPMNSDGTPATAEAGAVEFESLEPEVLAVVEQVEKELKG